MGFDLLLLVLPGSDKNNKRKMREVVKEFSLLCRGLLGTEYVEVAKQFL